MNYYQSTFSYGSTGTKSITVGFQPLCLVITLSARFGTTDAVIHKSTGNSNGTSQHFHSEYGDSTGFQMINGTNKIVSQYERVASVLTEKVAAHIDNATAAWTTTQVKFIVDTADSNYQFFVQVWG